ncbi:MAG TPA: PIN domain-containing protein [Rubrivivax sp.]|nr:PIN domain-containing protein [Rubrivivax sp.]
MRLAVDTNILVYAEGEGDAARCARANDLMCRLSNAQVVVPVQVVGELFRVLHGKFRRPADEVRLTITRWSDLHAVADSSWSALQAALDLGGEQGLQIWDALILAVAAEQRCSLLLSEDLQHGYTWRGVTVMSPFAEPVHPRLAALLG